MIVISTLCSHLLDGLPAEQIPRQEGVEGRGAPDDSAIVGAGGSPKAAGVLGHPSPEQVAAALAPQARGVPVAGVGAHQPVGAARGAQAARGGSSVGLPAGGGRQRLPLRQESIHFFLTSKLRQDRGVAQDTHVQRLLGLGCLLLGTVSDHSIPLGQVQVECDERAVLQTQGPQCGAIDLGGEVPKNQPAACSP